MKKELKAPDQLHHTLDKQAASLDEALLKFLDTEADTGLTFVRIASSSTGIKRRRNVRNARKAYQTLVEKRDTALHLGARLEPIDEKIRELKRMLVSLGEHFDGNSGTPSHE